MLLKRFEHILAYPWAFPIVSLSFSPNFPREFNPQVDFPLLWLYSWILNWKHLLIKFRRGCERLKLLLILIVSIYAIVYAS